MVSQSEHMRDLYDEEDRCPQLLALHMRRHILTHEFITELERRRHGMRGKRYEKCESIFLVQVRMVTSQSHQIQL